jgi:hypothetical protein
MNHEEAIRSQAAAGYLLGDLTPEERDAFEEHYFDCRECGDAVRSGATMFASGPVVVEKESSFRRFRPLKSALTGAAAAALIVVGTYQTAVIPRVQSLSAPPVMEIVRPTPLPLDETRGEKEEQTIRFTDEKPLALYRDIPSDAPPFPRYQVELSAAAGKVLISVDVPEDMARSGEISLSVRPLPAGRYQLVIVGVRKDGNRSEVASWPVVVQ